MRIVTRADFDGIVCAALLYEAESITSATEWVEPSQIQHGQITARPGDIVANLPYAKGCALWFDHHVTNRPGHPFNGLYRLAPSAARLVYEYYQERLTRNYDELIQHTDDIDSANLSMDQVMHPQRYPYLLLSMTLNSRNKAEEPYWNHLVQLLRATPIDRVMRDVDVQKRADGVIRQNAAYETLLRQHTHIQGQVAISDFRSLDPPPDGNRFLVYSLFPDAIVAVKIRHSADDRQKVLLSVGRSIFNRGCQVNVGQMLAGFGGGGHAGAGATTFPAGEADAYISNIINLLIRNEAQMEP